MPKLGMEPIRRSALVDATIHEVGRAGSLDVTVTTIARRAGVSSALAHHYFGGKEQLFLASMRHLLTEFGHDVRARLRAASTPRDRVVAIIRGCFEDKNFNKESVAAWLNFYVLSQTSGEAMRLLRIYQRRLDSNLTAAIRPLAGARAGEVAAGVGALIDGVYIRQALNRQKPNPQAAVEMVSRHFEQVLAGGVA